MTLRRYADPLRALVPRVVREVAYEWHPGRARRWSRYPGLQRLATCQAAVLTFDDGPDPDATPAVLDALQAAGAQATFFFLGCQLERHRDIASEVIARGHEIGLHGYQHLRHDRESPAATREDLRRGLAMLQDMLGIRCRWYRPPYGKVSHASAQTCAELNLEPVYWSGWGLDWESVSAERIAAVVSSQIDDGGIILLHDSARYARRLSATPTADALPLIARRAEAAGLQLIRLDDALERSASATGKRA